MDSALWQAYQSAHYRVLLSVEPHIEVSLRIGHDANGLASSGPRSGYILTAHNPRSKRLAAADNQRLEQQLLQFLRQQNAQFLPTLAVDPNGCWPNERGVLWFDVTITKALQLAAKFEQNAVVSVPQTGLVECIAVEKSASLSG